MRGMRTSYDEVLADGARRMHPPQCIMAALLKVEVADKKARSIQYRMTTAKLPMAKDISDFYFSAGPVSESLIHQLADGALLAARRNMVLVSGTGTGKTHLAVAVTRMCIRNGATGRFYNVVDLVNQLEAEIREGRQGRLSEQLLRRNFVNLDELGYLPFARSGGELLFHLISKLYHRVSIVITTNPTFEEWPTVFGDKKMTAVLLDRFTHHREFFVTGNEGWSFRIRF